MTVTLGLGSRGSVNCHCIYLPPLGGRGGMSDGPKGPLFLPLVDRMKCQVLPTRGSVSRLKMWLRPKKVSHGTYRRDRRWCIGIYYQ